MHAPSKTNYFRFLKNIEETNFADWFDHAGHSEIPEEKRRTRDQCFPQDNTVTGKYDTYQHEIPYAYPVEIEANILQLPY